MSHQLEPDSAVLMTAWLSVREDEEPKLLLEKVEPLRGAHIRPEKPTPVPTLPEKSKLFLRLRRDQFDAATAILKRTPGTMRVLFYAMDEGKTYVAPEAYWVRRDFDREALELLLGEGSVVVKEPSMAL